MSAVRVTLTGVVLPAVLHFVLTLSLLHSGYVLVRMQDWEAAGGQ